MAKVALKAEVKLARLTAQATTDREEMLQHLLQYAQTDLLCYRVPPEAVAAEFGDNAQLYAQQEKTFTPILDWFAGQGMHFIVTDALMPVAQPNDSLKKLATHYAQASDRELAALSLLVPLLGSALLTFALWKKQVTVEEALLATRLDEDHQSARWGTDPHEAANWAAKAEDVRAAAIFLDR